MLPVALLVLGASIARSRVEFTGSAARTSGEVVWTTRYHMGVMPPGQTLAIDVSKPVLSLYRRGSIVNVVYDSSRYYPGQLTSYGYVDSFVGLWLMPVLLMAAGGLMLIAGFMNGRVRGFRFGVNIARIALLFAVAGALGACRSSEVADVCTEIGCSSGLTVMLTGDIPDDYRVVVKPFGREPVEKTCSVTQLCESTLFFEGVTRENVEVEVHIGTRLVRRSFTVPYTEKRPNGPGCEPVCLQGIVTVAI